MSELAGLEAAAIPIIESVAKNLEPEAGRLLEEFRQYAYEKEVKLAADVHQLLVDHHTGLLGKLVDLLAVPAPAAPTVDPTPAVPAPQS